MLELINHPLNLSLSTLVSEDLAYFLGLFSVQNGSYTALTFVFFYSFGILLGDFILYGIGFLGRYLPFLKKWVDKKKKSGVIGQFEEFLLVTRFLPGSRLPTYLYCGYTAYHPIKFGVILLFSTLFYAIFGVLLLKFFNFNIHPEDPFLKKAISSLSIALVTIFSFKQLVKILMIKQKYGEWMRPLLIHVKRLKHLEFWNSWLLYLPFVPRFITMLIRYRGFGVCLNSNPAIFMSGIIGEKKSEIDKLLAHYIPENSIRTLVFNSQVNHKYPLAIKPDSGLRGIDVGFVNSRAELEKYLSRNKKKIVVQEFCPYENEWGVFYIRYPHQQKGCIFSITLKQLPQVLGDGKSTLYDLVMQDEVLKLRYDWLFANGGPTESLDPMFIPMEGENYLLMRKGSHSKGCVFLDGKEFIANALPIARALDKIPEFYIGRADVKFNSLEGLKRGEFKIIEVNGAAAESTNIYDPNLSKKEVYRILALQWQHIFEIGSRNSKCLNNSDNVIDLFHQIFIYKGLMKTGARL